MEHLRLSRLNPGDKGRVQSIVAGAHATKRLYDMGFNTGAIVQVLKNDRGPIIVSFLGSKVALGRGLADKMIVDRQ